MKIAVLVSGGVDSSVALSLLKKQGHDVTAFYLKIWLEDELSYLGDCPWEQDLAFVRQVCKQLDVPLKIVSLQKEYHEHIVGYTIDQVKKGFTPNPDVLCNTRIKFGTFLNHLGNQYDKIASGHYAQIDTQNDTVVLKQAPDPIKDQTYFLSHVPKDQLEKLLFPIGNLNKEQVRQLAQEFDLPNKDRKDSQGICFLGKLKYKDFIKHYLGEKPGDIIEWETKQMMGTHRGFWFYTIGQRQGLGLAGGPWYVVSKDTKKNIVYISRNYYSPEKKRSSFQVGHCNWIGNPSQNNLKVKLRHGASFHDCTLVQDSKDVWSVTLKDRDQGIASGQFAVFYKDSICLGSGVIL